MHKYRKKKKKKKDLLPKRTDIAILEKLPQEVIVYHILRFLHVFDLFPSVLLVNHKFSSLVWKSLKNYNKYQEELIIKKSATSHRKNRGPMWDSLLKGNKTCSYDFFLELVDIGAVNIRECGKRLISYFGERVTNLRGFYDLEVDSRYIKVSQFLETSKKFDRYKMLLSFLTRLCEYYDLIECKKRIEENDDDIRSSFFHSAYVSGKFRVVELCLRFPDLFRIPNEEESKEYLKSRWLSEAATNSFRVYLEDCFPKLRNIQEFFECYLFLSDQDLNYHYNGPAPGGRPAEHQSLWLEIFLDIYIPLMLKKIERAKEKTEDMEKEEKEETKEDEPIKIKEVYLSSRMIRKLIRTGKRGQTRRMHFRVGDKLHQVIRFISLFGITREKEKGVFDPEKKRLGERQRNLCLKTLEEEIRKSDEIDQKFDFPKLKERRKDYFYSVSVFGTKEGNKVIATTRVMDGMMEEEEEDREIIRFNNSKSLGWNYMMKSEGVERTKNDRGRKYKKNRRGRAGIYRGSREERMTARKLNKARNSIKKKKGGGRKGKKDILYM